VRTVVRAAAIMNRRPILLAPRTPVREAARVLLHRRAPGAIVVDDDHRWIGLFSQQGLVVALVQTAHHALPAAPVADFLDTPPPTLTEGATLPEIAHLFLRSGAPPALLPVLRESRVVGAVTRLDVARALDRALRSNDEPVAPPLYLSARSGAASPFDPRGRP